MKKKGMSLLKVKKKMKVQEVEREQTHLQVNLQGRLKKKEG